TVMKLIHSQLSAAGPVRPNNEDWVGFWEPEEEAELLTRGALAVLADGVGGHADGEIASQLAGEVALRRFLEIKPGTRPKQVLAKLFSSANIAIYDRSLAMHRGGH